MLIVFVGQKVVENSSKDDTQTESTVALAETSEGIKCS